MRVLFGAILAAAIGTATPAFAVTFFSPPLFAHAGSALGCVVTNVGTKPLAVQAALLDTGSGVPIPVNDVCAIIGTVPPGGSCAVIATVALANAYCRVDVSSSKIRALLQVNAGVTGEVIAVVPLTK